LFFQNKEVKLKKKMSATENQQPTLDNEIAKGISEFETNKLKKVGVVNEKVVLPSKEGNC
jgi:hypothetical protein